MTLSLLPVACTCTMTVIACAGVGAYARAQGLMSKEVEKGMDKLISSIFLPCLMLHSVTPNMRAVELNHIWPLALNCVCIVLYGLLASSAVSRCLAAVYPDAFPKYTGLMMVAVAFPNSFSVPWTLLLALGDNPVLLAGGQPGGEALTAQINMLFLMSYAFWVLARWSIGYPIMSGALSLSDWGKKVLNPPVVACLVAGIAGLIWRLAPTEFQSGGKFADIFDPISVALGYAGRCCVPATLMQLGAKLHAVSTELLSRVSPDLESTAQPLHIEVDASMPPLAYVVTLLLRQVGGPLVGGVVACGILRGLCGVDNNVVLMVAMLQSAGPPMINLGVMAGLTGCAEKETAKLLLFTYIFSVFTWTTSIACFLQMLQ
jgi:predicted permease